MSPSDNNPLTPSGSSIPSPVDFTNPSSMKTDTSGLSMSDTLASAQDNLTSAGQAAGTLQSDAIGLNQIGADDPSASMITPDQPLTPAAPVPGSIGSVTSVPPLKDESSLGGSSAGASMGTPTTPTPVTTSTMPTFGGGSSNTTAPSAATEPVKPPYNPFARPMGAENSNETQAPATPSSATVPAALQPQTEKFSDRLNAVGAGKKSSPVTAIVGWVMAVICAIAAVIFAMLWIKEANKEPEIKYIEIKPVEQTISMMSCAADFGEEVVEGLENLTGHTSMTEMRFTDEVLTSIGMTDRYTFVDNGAALLAQGTFDEWVRVYMDVIANVSNEAIEAGSELEDNTIVYATEANAAQLTSETAYLYRLGVNASGSVEKGLDAVKTAYQNAGYVCNVE